MTGSCLARHYQCIFVRESQARWQEHGTQSRRYASFRRQGNRLQAKIAPIDGPNHCVLPVAGAAPEAGANSFAGSKPGHEREVAGIRLCWCPAGRFLMGSPPSEPDRRPDEDQVLVTLTEGFLSRSDVTTTSAFASRLSGRNRPDDEGPIAPKQSLDLTGATGTLSVPFDRSVRRPMRSP